MAAFLSESRRRRILLSFVGQERSLSEVSAALEMPLNLLHHHVKRLLTFGILEVVREQRRAGRPIRYYRATADAFFIPATLMASSVGATLSRELRAGLDAAAHEAAGMVLDLDGAGRPRLRLMGDKLPSIPWEAWRLMRLSRKAAMEFGLELNALLRRYERQASDTGPTYLFHAAFIRRRPS